jgi:rRNA small subunit pseudouridine methyltransferase Nep1
VLHLILADSELEQVPREIAGHRVIKQLARRRGRRPTELLLNSSLHFPAMRKLPDADRRGRPDIVHVCLLLALDAPLNREGLLRTYVHTRHDKLITVDPSVHLPRMFYRFEGLMEHLFLTGAAPPENPLLHLEDASLKSLLERLKPRKVVTFSERGEQKLLNEIFGGLSKEEDVCVIVGGFPHGDFLSDVKELSDELVSIDPEPLHASTVLSRAIHAYENTFGVQELRMGRST